MDKKKGSIAVVCLAVVIGVGGYGIYRNVNAEETDVVTKETSVEYGNLTVGITESGSVALGTVEQTFDIDLTESDSLSSDNSSGTSVAEVQGGIAGGENGMAAASMTENNASSASSSDSSDISLEVEEVYVSAGQVVEKEDPLLKLSKDSVQEARAFLEEQIDCAKLTLENAKLKRKSTKVEAQYEYEQNIATGQTAKTTYNATLTSLANAVEEAQDAVDDAEDRMDEIKAEIKVLKKKKKTISVSGATTTAKAAGNKMSDTENTTMNDNNVGVSTTPGSSTANSDTSTVSGINAQIQVLEQELESLEKNYNNLVSKVSQAKSAQISGKITAKQTYEKAVLNYENAQQIYDIAVNGLDDDVNDAKESLQDAKQNLEDFEDVMQEGIVTCDYAGTILSVGYEAGDSLSSDTALATFADADAVTLTVSVSQEDVSNVNIDDVVNIVFSAYEEETYHGVVTGIATSETSSDSSTVDYDVTVQVTGDVSKIYEGMTANVTFVTKELKDVIYVSNKAIITEGTKSYVKKVEGENVTKVEVTTGFSNGSAVEIQSGLKEGDTVLIESQVSAS